MHRRRFLQAGATVGVVSALGSRPISALARLLSDAAPSLVTGGAYVSVAEFPSGVLSGDPTLDGVVLWTRIDPATAGSGVAVTWELGTDPAFAAGTVLATGTEGTSPTEDHTVHIEVAGLTAGSTYWYRFTVAGVTSPVGRTKTLPAPGAEEVRIAYFSCQRYVHGYYSAHADLAARALDPATDVDLVVSLGDYVYEAGPADGVTVVGRVDPEAPTVTLDDFRRQYHLYRTDLDLQAMHAAHPVVGIFDNHDGMGDPSDPAGPGAVAAFFEQMPVRRQPGEPNRQHRSFSLGGMVDLFMLDERQYRDPEPPTDRDNPFGTSSVDEPSMVAPGRTTLGAPQKTWLLDGLAGSDAAWKVIGSQLVFWPFRSEAYPDVQATAGDGPQRNAGRYFNMTQWDGYQAERREVVDHIVTNGTQDVVVISGDSHFWQAAEVPQDWDDPTSPSVLTEFAGSSISSGNADEVSPAITNDLARQVLSAVNPLTLRYIEVTRNGYAVLEATADRMTVSYLSPTSITVPDQPTELLARFAVDRGTARITHLEGEGFLPRPADAVDPTDPTSPGGGPTAPPAAPIPADATFTG